jgi:hypothetical protein
MPHRQQLSQEEQLARLAQAKELERHRALMYMARVGFTALMLSFILFTSVGLVLMYKHGTAPSATDFFELWKALIEIIKIMTGAT